MTKKTISKNVLELHWDGLSLEQLAAEIQELIEEYGSNATVSLENEPYSDDMGLHLYTKTLETDKQYADRLAAEDRYAVARERNERAELLRLQTKFSKPV